MGDGQVGGRALERWQVVSKKERKDGRRGEACTSGNRDWEAR